MNTFDLAAAAAATIVVVVEKCVKSFRNKTLVLI